MMDMLAGRGEIAVAGRAGTHRVWDLPERVWPETETLSWREAERELEARRRRRHGAWLQRGEWHAHPDIPDEPVPDRVTVLSPFDGLVKDRDRAESLWGFRYRLEMYVPQAKREYGYYVLPLLAGDEVVGRAEPRFDRKTGTLELLGAWGDTSRLDEALAELDRVAHGVERDRDPHRVRRRAGAGRVVVVHDDRARLLLRDLVGHVHRVRAAAAGAAAGGRERLADHLAAWRRAPRRSRSPRIRSRSRRRSPGS